MNLSHSIEIAASILFGAAILHTFAVKRFQHLASRYPEGSIAENFFHLLGEVELVFGLWAGLLVLLIAVLEDTSQSVKYIESLSFTEPVFVFVIMAVASTSPVIFTASKLIEWISKLFPFNASTSYYATALIIGPLLGSFITEPAAMTVTALILRDRFFDKSLSQRFLYSTLGVLFVNISIGGTLTHYAAPPVLMVASKWNWGLSEMMSMFGWKAAIAVMINTAITSVLFSKDLKKLKTTTDSKVNSKKAPPFWLCAIHLFFLVLIVFTAHYASFFIGVFLFFIGFVSITKEYQKEINLKDSLLVGFFLAGLVVLGGLQTWWLKPLIAELNTLPLFLGATLLTAFMDNAALTYLGAQVSDISDALKYALVAGAVSGGGLTVIANAPNPAGFSILKSSFGKEGISPVLLFSYAFLPTLVAMICFWFL